MWLLWDQFSSTCPVSWAHGYTTLSRDLAVEFSKHLKTLKPSVSLVWTYRRKKIKVVWEKIMCIKHADIVPEDLYATGLGNYLATMPSMSPARLDRRLRTLGSDRSNIRRLRRRWLGSRSNNSEGLAFGMAHRVQTDSTPRTSNPYGRPCRDFTRDMSAYSAWAKKMSTSVNLRHVGQRGCSMSSRYQFVRFFFLSLWALTKPTLYFVSRT